jgi:hypothetical protein
MTGSAEFSDCMRFRYTLTRKWSTAPILCVIGLNPSTATEAVDDPTIRRCIGYAKAWDYGGLLMLNIFAYRATLPSDMWAAARRGVDIIGGERNYYEAMGEYIRQYQAVMTLAAWGREGGERGRGVQKNLPNLYCLGVNSDRSPKHPLYLRADLKPLPLRTFAQ